MAAAMLLTAAGAVAWPGAALARDPQPPAAQTTTPTTTPARPAQSTASRPAARPAARTFTHDGTGLQRELQPFLDTYAASVPGLGQTLTIFVVPNSDTWFGARFPKEGIAQLVSDQKSAIASYEQALIGNMGKWPAKTHFQVACVARPGAGDTALQARPGEELPTSDVTVESYSCTFAASADSATEQRTFVNLANFVYVDGAFRFVGVGFYPFWATAKQ